MAFTKVLGPGIHTLSNITSHNIHSSGIITATGFDGPFTNLNVTGVTTFSGDVSIGGTLTYEDVKNIDSIGIITARSDLNVDGHTNLDNVSIVGNSTITSSGSGTGKLRIEGAVQGTKIHLHRASTDSVAIRFQNNFGNIYAGLRNGFNNDQRFAISNSGTLGNNTIFQASENYNVIVGTAVTFSGTTGDATFTGIITATGADINGDLDVDGHTNLDNVDIVGVVTVTGAEGGDSTINLFADEGDDNEDKWRIRVGANGNNLNFETAYSGSFSTGTPLKIAGNGIVTITGSLIVDQVNINGNAIQPNTSNTNLQLKGSGSGYVEIDDDIEFTSGIRDKDGDLGSSGQVLSSTGTQVNWVAAQSGPTGPTGPTGAQGAAGSTGAQGDDGSAGSTGAQGATGPTGAQGATGSTGAQGAAGSNGSTGAQGADGNFGGATFDYTFSTSTTDSDPGTGKLRFNNGTLSSATVMYIDDTDDGGTDIQAFLRTIDDSTSTIKGHVRVSNRLNADDFALFTISGTNTEATGYHKVNVSYLSGATSFSNNEDIIVTFARTGTKGDTGAQGAAGSNGSTGAQGAAGSNGSTGAQGATGPTGAQGATAAQGAQGATGSTGPTGAQGAQGAAGSGGGGGANVSVSSNPPNSPDGGDLWWDSDVGELFIYYADGDSNQWVETSGGSETVTVSDDAPSSPNSGDLWWESDTGQLKIYYNDGDSAQWVDANAGVLSKLTVWQTNSAGIHTLSNVGFGTTNPTAPIQIQKDGTDQDIITVGHFQSAQREYILKTPESTSHDDPFRWQTGNAHAWETDDTERMRIHSNGNVGIGVASPDENLHVSGTVKTEDSFHIRRSSNGTILDYFRVGEGNLFIIDNLSTDSNTRMRIRNTQGTISYNSSSDYRLKENDVNISDGITRIKKLRPIRFNWVKDNTTTYDGFFAHEVSDACPEAVDGTKDQVALEDDPSLFLKKGDPIYQGIDNSKLVPLLTAALQESIAKIEVLEAEVAALKSS